MLSTNTTRQPGGAVTGSVASVLFARPPLAPTTDMSPRGESLRMRSGNEPVRCLLFVVLLARAVPLALCLPVYLSVSELQELGWSSSLSFCVLHSVSLSSTTSQACLRSDFRLRQLLLLCHHSQNARRACLPTQPVHGMHVPEVDVPRHRSARSASSSGSRRPKNAAWG